MSMVPVPNYLVINKSIKGMKIGIIKECFEHQASIRRRIVLSELIDSNLRAEQEIVPRFNDRIATYYVIAPSEASQI